GCARPVLTGWHLAEHRRAGPYLGRRTDGGAGAERAAGPDPGVLPDRYPADVQPVAVEPVAGEVDLGLDRAAIAQGEESGHRRARWESDVLGDPHTHAPGV